MTVNKSVNGKTATLAVSGRLDTTTAPKLEAEVEGVTGGCEELILDFEGLEYISSAGLRVLLKAQKTMSKKGSMKLIHVNNDVKEVFDITGFLDILTIE